MENKSPYNPRDLSWYQVGLQGHKWWGYTYKVGIEKKRKEIYLLNLELEES